MLCNEFLNFKAVLSGGPPFFFSAQMRVRVADSFIENARHRS